MTLDELRHLLMTHYHLPGDTLVVLQKDAEGNGYSPLSGGEEAMYLAHSTWSGETHLTPEQLAEKLRNPELGYDEEGDAAPEGSVRVLILYPVN